jgi:hypothetical protein
MFSFILYICSQSPISIQAEKNLNAMCLGHFPDHHLVEIVDLLQDPQRGLVDGVIVCPTLVRISPGAKTNCHGKPERPFPAPPCRQLKRQNQRINEMMIHP